MASIFNLLEDKLLCVQSYPPQFNFNLIVLGQVAKIPCLREKAKSLVFPFFGAEVIVKAFPFYGD